MEAEVNAPFPDTTMPYSTGVDSFTMHIEEELDENVFWVNRKSFYHYSFELAAEENTVAAQFISNRLPVTNPTSERAFSLIKSWIHNCDENHDCTRRSTSTPRRVIQVSGADFDTVQLVEFNDQRGRYVALSYCWGISPSDQQVVTTTENIESHLQRINVANLPQTIQDAITVTRRLALEYLWVDALCIVQDSDTDKVSEITIMGSIYSNAYLTISAANASGCGSGFLKPSKPARFLGVPYRLPNGVIDKVYLRLSIPEIPDAQRLFLSEKIHGRGWTFQETFLSRRILFYSTIQPYFKCQRHVSAAGIPDPGYYFRTTGIGDIFETFGNSKTNFTATHSRGISPWCQLVGWYSRRFLSLHSDRLLAIAAVAKAYGQRTGDQYLVGLWKRTFATDLLWEARGPGPYEGKGRPVLNQTLANLSADKDPKPGNVPSWSWVSCLSKITYDVFPLRNPKSCISIISDITSDDLGYLANGPLILHGIVKNVLLPRTKANTSLLPGSSFVYDPTCCWNPETQAFTTDNLRPHGVGVITFDDAKLRGDTNDDDDDDSDDDNAWDEPLSAEEAFIALSDSPLRNAVTLPCLAIAYADNINTNDANNDSDGRNLSEMWQNCVVKALVLELLGQEDVESPLSSTTTTEMLRCRRIGLFTGTERSGSWFSSTGDGEEERVVEVW
ncbi:MAG: hypothetical protein Q9160_003308 [Pyrenula sp. 1 TL-2023]